MPKSYSDYEREAIKEALLHHGAECIATYGIKKTTVDELVRRANIPKGTFYLFYPSKEVLLFQVIQNWHDKIQQDIWNTVQNLGEKPDVETLTDIIFDIFTQLDQTGIIRCLNSGELETLIRKLPIDIVKEHLEHDDDMMEQLIKLLPGAEGKNVEVYSAAFRGVFLLLLHKRELGEVYRDAMKLAIKGLFIQLIGGNEHD